MNVTLFYTQKKHVRKRLTTSLKCLPFVQQLFQMVVCVTYFHSRNEFVDFQIFGFIRAVIETKQELGRAIPI